MAPHLDSSSYYLYELASSSYISDSEISLALMDENGVVPDATVSLGDVVTSGDYKYYPIVIDTSSVDMSTYTASENTYVVADLNKMMGSNLVAYHLTMNVDVTFPYQIGFKDILPDSSQETVIANQVVVTDSNSQKVDIDPVEGIDFSAVRPEYRIEGWYAERNVTNADGSVTEEKVKVLNADGSVVSESVDGFVEAGSLLLSEHFVVLHPVWFKSYTATEVTDFDVNNLGDDETYIFVKAEPKGTFTIQSVYARNEELRDKKIALQNYSSNESVKFTGFAEGTNFVNDLDCIWKGSDIKALDETEIPSDRTLYVISILDEDKFDAYDPQPVDVQTVEAENEQEAIVEEPISEEVAPEQGEEIVSDDSGVSE